MPLIPVFCRQGFGGIPLTNQTNKNNILLPSKTKQNKKAINSQSYCVSLFQSSTPFQRAMPWRLLPGTAVPQHLPYQTLATDQPILPLLLNITTKQRPCNIPTKQSSLCLRCPGPSLSDGAASKTQGSISCPAPQCRFSFSKDQVSPCSPWTHGSLLRMPAKALMFCRPSYPASLSFLRE